MKLRDVVRGAGVGGGEVRRVMPDRIIVSFDQSWITTTADIYSPCSALSCASAETKYERVCSQFTSQY